MQDAFVALPSTISDVAAGRRDPAPALQQAKQHRQSRKINNLDTTQLDSLAMHSGLGLGWVWFGLGPKDEVAVFAPL